MMQRTMVLTLRQVGEWKSRQITVLKDNFRIPSPFGDRTDRCRKHRLPAIFVYPRGKRVAASPDV
ncbi:hypothetical protein [Rhizobium leguminosarum]|uniref:hypothetical protein n=1 Tax=Rhizobium leguminosarum TaxID=384 RepID=UPI001AE31FA3|nr:hypothetical protein [Rhizobium leguminosarum]MBP2445521.1 hypothetical protein [Rhizobium leguminosarum]